MYDVILHHYDASPFTQKALKMLAIKGLSWGSVETPMIAPKPELTPLTGGYRGTPVLQIGADIYVDNLRILAALDAHFPTPAISSAAHALDDAAVGGWGDRFFESGLHMAIHEYQQHWDDDFAADRKDVFARLDFDNVKANFKKACSQLRVHAGVINAQLSDGRAFLRGDSAGMADIHAWPVLWFTRNMTMTDDMLSGYEHLPAWEARVNAIGEGKRTEIQAADAFAKAKSSEPADDVSVDSSDPLGLEPGTSVTVRAVTSDRGTSRGKLVGLNSNEAVIALDSGNLGTVHVHFPRLGYRVSTA